MIELMTLTYSTKKLIPAITFLIVLLSTTVLPILMDPPTALAGSDTYPTSTGGCRAVSGSPGGSFTCDLKGSTQDQYYDPWGEENRECVSYAAWMLSSVNGFTMPFYADAVNWGPRAAALGYTVDMHPQPGSIFWDSTHDHVGWVETVSADGSSITYEDYNSTLTGLWGEHTVATSSASDYIHFKDISGPPPPTIPSTTLTQNGDFTSGSASWTASPGTNLAVYASNQFGPQSYYASYSGHNYATTGSSSASGFYQDIPLPANSSTGQTFCVTAEVRTSGGSSGGSGALALFQLGGASTEGEGTNFGSLGNTWQPIEACDTATTAHTTLRIEFYPTVNGPMLDIDNVDVHLALDHDGDFLSGYGGVWTASAGTNLAIYSNNQLGPQAYFASYAGTSGTNYASTNASSSSGFYQDIPVNTTAGQTYCVTAQVRTSGGASGGSGALALCELKQ